MSDMIPVEPLADLDPIQPCARCGEMTAGKLLPSMNTMTLADESGKVVRAYELPPMPLCNDCRTNWRPFRLRNCDVCKTWTVDAVCPACLQPVHGHGVLID